MLNVPWKEKKNFDAPCLYKPNLLMRAANKIIWIQLERCQAIRSKKGLVIVQTLLTNSCNSMSKVVRYLLVYPQQAFIQRVNKLYSAITRPCSLGVYLLSK